MYFRVKQAGRYRYLQIAESYREGRRVRQRVLATLGNLEEIEAQGGVDALLASGARFSEKVAVLDARKAGALAPGRFVRIGPDEVFRRIWAELGIGETLRETVGARRFLFEVERAVYLTVMHRLFESGSDRSAVQWREPYRLPGCELIELHQIYRSMGWLGSPLADQAGRTALGPRCVKDLIEERLFAGRRDLFSTLSVVFFDTTTIYFEGHGGATLGRRGKSKDNRPDLPQMVVAVVLDGEGMPLCCEMWPGNTTDVKTLLPVVERLRARFRIGQACIVADRGMISRDILSQLDEPDCVRPYILGVRLRAVKAVRLQVLGRAGRYRQVRDGEDGRDPLDVKEVWHEGRRYIVCRNPAQAERDRLAREQIVAALREKLRGGEKTMVGNKGFRKYLRKTSAKAFEIDERKIIAEARYDGRWVLTTSTSLTASEVALQYKRLWTIEDTFRTMKTILETRPVFHRLDRTIRGHVFCSFLALTVRRRLEQRLEAAGMDFEWAQVIASLREVQEAEADFSGRPVVIRSEMAGCSAHLFRAVGAPIPPAVRFPQPRGPGPGSVVPQPGRRSVTH